MTPTPAFDRREFLRRGARVGALAAGALASSATLAACESPRSSTTTTTTAGPPSAASWRALAASLTGDLIRPSDPSYAIDRLLYNSKFTDLHPAAIAYCATSEDVARCVDFAATHVVEFATRSGGHSYGGYSSCDGLVLDVSRLDAVHVDTRRNVATIGAGASMIDVYDALGHASRLLPGGSCPTVGIAGLALGGGVGVFGPRFGLTCDNLRSVDVVSASAATLTASASSHPDLFWACRGGGGGNFAVATAFEFDVHPLPEISLFTLHFSWEAAADLLDAWLEWTATAPDELWSTCQLFSEGTQGLAAQVSGVFCGATPGLAGLVARLRRGVGSAPTASFLGGDEYLRAMKAEAGCSSLSIAACHLPTKNPHGVLGHEAYTAKSSFIDSMPPSARTATLVRAVEALHAEAPTVGGGLAFDAFGGAINRVAPGDTAFVHRDKIAGIQAAYSWSAYSPAAEIRAGQRWLTWLGAHVLDPAAGAYQNYIDPTLSDWRGAYYGANLARLVKVKRAYDPDDLFSFAQSIPTRL